MRHTLRAVIASRQVRRAARSAADGSLRELTRRTTVSVTLWLCGGLLVVALTAQPAPPAATTRWFKGNLHTHTLNSDGDSTPDDVVRWYREHGYNFVTITDHNYLTSVDGLNALHGADDQFLVMKGEEVTDRFQNKPVHLNGFAPNTFIKPPGGSSVLDMAQRMIDAIRRAGAAPSVNPVSYTHLRAHE